MNSPSRAFRRSLRAVVLGVVFAFAAAARAQPIAPAAFPAPTEWAAPAGFPSAPGDAFPLENSLVLTNTPPPPSAPAIAEWNDTVKPGESFTLAGARFTTRADLAAGADTRVWLWAATPAGGALRACTIWKIEPDVLTATVPADLPFGLFLVWVENAAGVSTPVCLNRPVATWLGPVDQSATSGAVKRVFGRNLSHNRGETATHVFARPLAGGGAPFPLTVTSVEPFVIGFLAPEQPGNYQIHVHSGHGGAYGWSAPQPLTVLAAPAFVRGSDTETLAPAADGDDTAEFQAAIDRLTAKSAGGTLQLQAAVYRLSNRIDVKRGVALRGAGKALTSIIVDAPFDFGATGGTTEKSILILADQSELSDFTLQDRLSSVNSRLIRQTSNTTTVRLRDLAVVGATPDGRPRLESTYFGDYHFYPGVTTSWIRGTEELALAPATGDRSAEIQAAIDALALLSGGGTVRLAAGAYTLAAPITLRPGVRLLGAARDTTFLDLAPPARLDGEGRRLPDTLITVEETGAAGARTEQRFEALTLRPALPLGAGSFVFGRAAEVVNLRLANVRVTGLDSTFNGRVYLTVQRGEVSGCDFYREFVTDVADGLWAHHNRFFGGTYSDQENSFGTIYWNRRVVIEHNHLSTPDWPVGPDGRRDFKNFLAREDYDGRNFALRLYSGHGEQVYIARNTVVDAAPGHADTNKGELILFHAAYTGAYAQVASVDGTTLRIRTDGTVFGEVFPGELGPPITAVPAWSGVQAARPQDVVIIAGPGRGQARRIVSSPAGGDTIVVDTPWRVPPTADSVITITPMFRDNVVYRNDLSAFPEGYRMGAETRQSASAGVQFDGGAFHSVSEGNFSRRTYWGRNIFAWTSAPAFWNEFRDERAEQIFGGSGALLSETIPYAPHPPVTRALGNAFRDFTLSFQTDQQPGINAIHEQAAIRLNTSPLAAGNLFENVSSTGSAHGIVSQRDVPGWALFRGNTFANLALAAGVPADRLTIGVVASGGAGLLLADNTYGAPLVPYHGDSRPRATPLVRDVAFAATSGEAPATTTLRFANLGARPAAWRVLADPATPWLTALADPATLAPETTDGLLALAADPARLLPGRHSAELRLAANPPLSPLSALGPVVGHAAANGEFGFKVRFKVPGLVTALRFYRHPRDRENSYARVGTIWSATGTKLAEVEFTALTTSGWQEATLATPFRPTPDTTYVVSVRHKFWHVYTADAFAQPLDTPELTILGGVTHATSGSFPATDSTTNYFRDLVFIPDAPAADLVIPVAFDVLPNARQRWRHAHFATYAATGASADLADPDGDGANNLLEYALARSPLVSERSVADPAALLPVPDPAAGPGAVALDAGYAVARDPATGRLSLTFRRARAELTYVVEACSDLAAPAGSPDGWQSLATNPGAVGQLVTVPDTLPANPGDTPPPRRFLRLRVESP